MYKENKKKVTIIVLSYMSQSTIMETLNSISEQTYDHLLLDIIITDDASSDNTNLLINDWIRSSEGLFSRIVHIQNPQNLGIVRNLNGALTKVTSDWVKIIAADDLLLPDCISSFISITMQSECPVFFSKMRLFTDSKEGRSLGKINPPSYQQKILKKDLGNQRSFLFHSSFSATPAAFINMNALKAVGFADGNYKMMEDYPLWFKLNMMGYQFGFLNKITVLYRVGESVSQSNEKLVNSLFLNDIIDFEKYKLSLLKRSFLTTLRIKVWIFLFPFYIKAVKNKKNILSKLGSVIINILFKVGFFKSKLLLTIDKLTKCCRDN